MTDTYTKEMLIEEFKRRKEDAALHYDSNGNSATWRT